ncbi:MAG TPA: GTPase HflX [Candidatus Limnocylindria bacterium]|nr:GTPase HflX [Candidatus Limnocylindria bacterium]
MIETHQPAERAFLIGLDLPRARFDPEDSLDELATLVAAAGGEVVGRAVQRRGAPDPRTWIGKGKVVEISGAAKRERADLIVADEELTPAQQRNLEKELGVRVVDRSGVILDIFARHARTKEGRVQVELAQLQYMLPRLRGMWQHLERLGGGVGTRGPGETQLESDRRVVERRLMDLRGRLAEVQKQRAAARRSRARDALFLASLVGYTNAGKSTLMNALSGAGVLVADQPFATLDPTTRRAQMPNGTVVLLSDTVGFVNKLPPALVAAFRATLEELDDASLLVHVVDAAHPNVHERIAVVNETLASLGLADRRTLLVLNQADRLRGPEGEALREALSAEFPAAVFTSAKTGEGLEALRTRIAAEATAGWRTVKVLVPYAAGGLVQRVRERGALHREEHTEHGIRIEAEVPPSLAAELDGARLG